MCSLVSFVGWVRMVALFVLGLVVVAVFNSVVLSYLIFICVLFVMFVI